LDAEKFSPEFGNHGRAEEEGVGMSRINYELFEKLKKRILAEAEFVNMSDWISQKLTEDGEPCGTVGCIAGHCAMITFPKMSWKQTTNRYWNVLVPVKDRESGEEINVEEEAQKALGLTSGEADILFTEWPDYVSIEKPGTRAYAAAVVRWIDEFLADRVEGSLDDADYDEE
jgi:hypothetical protein